MFTAAKIHFFCILTIFPRKKIFVSFFFVLLPPQLKEALQLIIKQLTSLFHLKKASVFG